MKAPVELPESPHDHVNGCVDVVKCPKHPRVFTKLERRVVGHQDHKIVVTVRTGIAASGGPKQVDALGMVAGL